MAKINDIKYLKQVQGLSYRRVKEITGHSYGTIKKYEETSNFNFQPRKAARKILKIDQYKDLIDKWLISDIGKPHKQRHSATRIYARLKDKYLESLDISYRTVANYCSKKKKELGINCDEYLKLEHIPGAAQVDFGKLTFNQGGKEVKGSYLVLTLPYSNAGYMQIFRGETTECLLEGLKDIFKHLGKVPREIWFDNLSAAVTMRNKRDRILNETFARFAAHYNFMPKFCNPASGNEKGNVENKVGYFRRNYFVPIPEIPNVQQYNKHLLRLCDSDNEREHYQKKRKINEILQSEYEFLLPINQSDFEVIRFEKRRINKYGVIEVDTNKYSVDTKMKLQEVWVKISAHKIEILDEYKRTLVSHARAYDRNQYINTSWLEHLPLIIKKINALENSDFFQQLPKLWKDYLLKLQTKDRKKALIALEKILSSDNLEIATYVLQQVLNAKQLDPDILLLTYNKYKDNTGPRNEISLPPNISLDKFDVDLKIYDRLIKRKGEDDE